MLTLTLTHNLKFILLVVLALTASAESTFRGNVTERQLQGDEGRLVNIFHNYNIVSLDQALVVPYGTDCGIPNSRTPVRFEVVLKAHFATFHSSTRYQWILHENGLPDGRVMIESVYCPGKVVDVSSWDCGKGQLNLYGRKSGTSTNQVWIMEDKASYIEHCPSYIPGQNYPSTTATVAFESLYCRGQYIQNTIPVSVKHDQDGAPEEPDQPGGFIKSAFDVEQAIV